jgi:hypothetical protein
VVLSQLGLIDENPVQTLRYNRTLWAAAVLITIASAVWQRLSGPTHPVRAAVTLDSTEVRARLTRSHSIAADQPVRVQAPAGMTGEVRWRRFPTADPWQILPMTREGDALQAFLPRQPAAGKLQYQVHLRRGDATVTLPDGPVITRFKGDVSTWVLVTHVALMFASLLFSARATLLAIAGARTARPAAIALALWAVGGLALGPAVQKQAFDAWWTGWPFGTDLTDNKTLLAVVAWAVAAWRSRVPGGGRVAVLVAAFVTFVVFAIPHSLWGSEVDWQAVPLA